MRAVRGEEEERGESIFLGCTFLEESPSSLVLTFMWW
jgi:hypothetical protein